MAPPRCFFLRALLEEAASSSSLSSGTDQVRFLSGIASTPEVVEWRCGRSGCSCSSPSAFVPPFEGFLRKPFVYSDSFSTSHHINAKTKSKPKPKTKTKEERRKKKKENTHPLHRQLLIPRSHLLQPLHALPTPTRRELDVDLPPLEVRGVEREGGL